MTRNVTIRINDNKDSDSIVFASGKVRTENNSHYIEYSVENVDFVIGICDGIVTISRIAEESYTMVLQESKPHTFSVRTKYGLIDLLLIPLRIDYSITDSGLNLTLEYEFVEAANSSHQAEAFYLDIKCKYKKNP